MLSRVALVAFHRDHLLDDPTDHGRVLHHQDAQTGVQTVRTGAHSLPMRARALLRNGKRRLDDNEEEGHRGPTAVTI